MLICCTSRCIQLPPRERYRAKYIFIHTPSLHGSYSNVDRGHQELTREAQSASAALELIASHALEPTSDNGRPAGSVAEVIIEKLAEVGQLHNNNAELFKRLTRDYCRIQPAELADQIGRFASRVQVDPGWDGAEVLNSN